MKTKTLIAALVAFLALPAAAHADDWHWGPGIAYVSKINDVVDVYKADLKAQGKSVNVNKPVPIGIAVDAHYQWDTGLRLGFGLGPYLRLSGDAKHFELPVNGTIGFNFMPQEQVSAYVKGGIVDHLASGDYYESSQPGVLAAGGIEIAKQGSLSFTIEVSFDASKVELDTVPSGTVKLRSYETVVSFFVKF
jgi:hypothetical protein